MSISYKVWNFPSFPISKQLFHVPGAAAEGGYTSGGARITSPEPGGFSVLEIQPSFHVGEWTAPLASWLMSKGNGQILRVRLARTPQVASVRHLAKPENGTMRRVNPEIWDAPIVGDLVGQFSAVALEGSNKLVIDLTRFGKILQPGHVIGHAYDCYMIDEIQYIGNVATLTVTPPIRRDVAIGDQALFRPWFTGSIANPGDFRNTYDAELVGSIQLNKIVLNEVIVP